MSFFGGGGSGVSKKEYTVTSADLLNAIVTIDIVRPHFMEFHAEADAAGPTTALDEVFVEESPLTGG